MNLDIFLVRHGETEFNRHLLLQGWADSPLTERGKAVAQKTGEKLKTYHFDAVFCSTLPRTLATAQIILNGAEQSHLPIQELADLREYHFGQFEGRPSSEFYQAIVQARNLPDEETWLYEYRHGDYNKMAETVSQLDPNAETETQFVQRIWRGMESVVQQSPSQGGRVLVVTHGMVIVALLKSIDKKAILYKSPPNASVSRLQFDGVNWRILSVAETENI